MLLRNCSFPQSTILCLQIVFVPLRKLMRIVLLRPQLLSIVCWHTATEAFPGVAIAKSDLISFDEDQLLAVIDASRTWVSRRADELSIRNDMLPSLNGDFCFCRSRATHPVPRGLTLNEHESGSRPGATGGSGSSSISIRSGGGGDGMLLRTCFCFPDY
jgi:hypothetical protein